MVWKWYQVFRYEYEQTAEYMQMQGAASTKTSYSYFEI